MVLLAALTASPGSKLRDPNELDEPDDEQARKMRVAKDKLDVSLQSHPL